MRRYIDVVFVNPKGRYYVVLHQGKFWQVPRMNLTATSWVFKLAYTESLNEIFVAKNQALSCEHLAKILQTYELPKQLAGVSATHFLDWWSLNDYKVLGADNSYANTSDTNPNIVNSQTATPKTKVQKSAKSEPIQKTTLRQDIQIKPTADWVLNKLRQMTNGSNNSKIASVLNNIIKPVVENSADLIQKSLAQTNLQQDLTAKPVDKSTSNTEEPSIKKANTKQIDAKQTAEQTRQKILSQTFAKQADTKQKTNKIQDTQNTSTQEKPPKKQAVSLDELIAQKQKNLATPKPTTKIADGFDIFDDLLHELNEEVVHTPTNHSS